MNNIFALFSCAGGLLATDLVILTPGLHLSCNIPKPTGRRLSIDRFDVHRPPPTVRVFSSTRLEHQSQACYLDYLATVAS
ncbi:hypothetical protein TNCV_2126471 [Trichonephila clavipes]|nr:hypothetical protein TNCV_2126471 [Trichonephila clavipes]